LIDRRTCSQDKGTGSPSVRWLHGRTAGRAAVARKVIKMRTDITGYEVNPYKLRAIMDMVRRQGPLPRDQFDQILSPDDLLVWFGLTGKLDFGEEIAVKRELALMSDAEIFMELLGCKDI